MPKKKKKVKSKPKKIKKVTGKGFDIDPYGA